MAGEDVTISYGADLSSLKTALGGLKAASSAAGIGLASVFGAVGGVAATAAIKGLNLLGDAVVGTAGLLRDSVAAALESEQANRRLAEAVKRAGEAFSFTFDELKNSARVLQGNSIFSNEQIEAAQKVMIQYRLTGEQFRETQKLALDMAADLGQDPVQAAKTLAQALVDPEKAMLRLRVAGVSLSEGARHQIAELSELGDTYAAQKVLLEDLTKTYGGASAAAADTVSGGWQQMSNTLKDLMGSVGESFLPLLKEMVPVLKDIVQLFADWVKNANALFQIVTGANMKEISAWTTGLSAVLQGANMDINGTKPTNVKPRVSWGNGGDGLPGGTGPGGGAFRIEGESLGGISNKNIGFGIADGMVLAMRRSGVLDSLGGSKDKDIFAAGASDKRIAALAAGIKASVKASGQTEFKGGFEDSVDTFKRIQAAQYSTEKVEERQLTQLEKLVLSENEKRERDKTRNTTLIEISGRLKNGVPSVLQ